MDDLLVLTGDSVSARQVADMARRVADATERHPRFRPIRAGTKEPLRKVKAGFREFIDDELEKSAGEPLMILFGDPDRELYGTLNVFPDLRLDSAPRTHLVDASLPVAGLDAEGRDEFVAWAVDLFDALDVFHGYVTTSDMQGHRKQLIAEAFDRGEIAPPDWDDPLYTTLDRVVSDVYWVNYFGPGFVDRWGGDRFAAIGRPIEARPSGAVVVWATDTPPRVDRSVRRLTDYPWKAPFYAAIGLDAFTHETLDVPSPGQHVPTLHVHHDRPAGPATR
jgi:hypothetical protein